MGRCATPSYREDVFRPELLLQDRIWIDRWGCVRDPRLIDLDYARNLLHFLRRRVNRLSMFRAIEHQYQVTMARYEWAGDQAQLSIEHEAAEVLDQLTMPVENWLNECAPLYQLLLERVTKGC